MKTVAHMLILEMFVGAGCLAQTKKTEDGDASSRPKLEPMPQSLEIRFALSAAPLHLRSDATTFLLDPAKGYERNHQGTNGVSCIVVRSDWQWSDKPFRDDIFWPVCYDAEGSKTLLQDYIYAAELRARGMSVKHVHDEVTKRFGDVLQEPFRALYHPTIMAERPIFKWRHFAPEIILCAVRWYL